MTEETKSHDDEVSFSKTKSGEGRGAQELGEDHCVDVLNVDGSMLLQELEDGLHRQTKGMLSSGLSLSGKPASFPGFTLYRIR